METIIARPAVELVAALEPRLSVLLIDDDPLFTRIMRRDAKGLPIDLVVCGSFDEWLRLSGRSKVDVAVVDYYLGELTGVTFAGLSGESVPILLISGDDRAGNETFSKWPKTIKRFINKDQGTRAILSGAVELGAACRRTELALHAGEGLGGGMDQAAWLVPAVLAVALFLALSWAGAVRPNAVPEKLHEPLRWDALPAVSWDMRV